MTFSRASTGRARWFAAAVLVTTFLAGALSGVAADRLLGGRWHGEHHGRPHGAARIFAPEGPLGERLDLTPAQRRRIDAILAADRGRVEAVLGEMRPRLARLFDGTTARIRAVLTPEQQREFDDYLAERRTRLRHRDREESR